MTPEKIGPFLSGDKYCKLGYDLFVVGNKGSAGGKINEKKCVKQTITGIVSLEQHLFITSDVITKQIISKISVSNFTFPSYGYYIPHLNLFIFKKI